MSSGNPSLVKVPNGISNAQPLGMTAAAPDYRTLGTGYPQQQNPSFPSNTLQNANVYGNPASSYPTAQLAPPPGYPPQQGAPPAYSSQGAQAAGYPPQQGMPQGYPQGVPPGYPPQQGASPGYPPQQGVRPGYPPQGAPGMPQGYPPPGNVVNGATQPGGNALGYSLAGLAGATIGGFAGYSLGHNQAPPPVNPMSSNYMWTTSMPMQSTMYPQAGYSAAPPSMGYAGDGYGGYEYPLSASYLSYVSYPTYPSAYPISWVRPSYEYLEEYYPHIEFVIPVGLPPHLSAKMMQASAAFRMFDTNRSGSLSKKEWKRALRYLGYPVSKGTAKHMFYAIDTNYSGRISEREFCEWWITAFPY